MIWLPLASYGDRYDVSDAGEVRIRATGRNLAKTKRYDGYFFVSLQWKGGRTVKMVHALVAEAHIGPRPDGLLVRHLDGDRQNNSLPNLVYGSPLENAQDARRHGVVATGERNGQSRLTEQGVVAIRRLHGLVPAEALAIWLGVSPTIIGQAQRGETWRSTAGEMSVEQALRTIFIRTKWSQRTAGKDAYATAAGHYADYLAPDAPTNPYRRTV